METPKPLANVKLYIIKGNKNYKNAKVLKTLTTDTNGYAMVLLPKGTYALLDSTQVKPLAVANNTDQYVWDANCLKRLWEQPLKTIIVGTKSVLIKYNFHKNCFYDLPCGTYDGPLPE